MKFSRTERRFSCANSAFIIIELSYVSFKEANLVKMFVEESERMLESSLLPQSVFDITERPIEAAHFTEYMKHLEYLLPNLFDVISSKEIELFEAVPETQKFRKLFVEFVCEQTGDCDFFRTDAEVLRRNLVKFQGKIKKMLNDDEKLKREMILLYKSKLIGQEWKRNFGAIYGFLQFCRIAYSNQRDSLDLDQGMFILSIGTQFLENVDPSFKLQGLKLFSLLIECMDEDLLRETNTHEVIYAQVRENVEKILDQECTQEIWKCIWLAVKLDKRLSNDLEWNKIDDCLQTLIYKLKTESNPGTRRFLQEILLQFVSFSISDRESFEVSWNSENSHKLLNDLKLKSITFDNMKCYRWTKSLLDMFVCQFLTIVSSREEAIRTIRVITCKYPFRIPFLMAFFAVCALGLSFDNIHNQTTTSG